MYSHLRYLSLSRKEIPVTVASSFKSKLLGLMGKKEGEYALLLLSCNSIHTCFMRYRLDALFLDENDQIVAIKRNMKPFTMVPPVKGAVKVLEFPSSLHAAAFLTKGSKIELY